MVFEKGMKKTIACILGLCLAVIAVAQDTQWRGPARDGIYPDTGLLESWPEGGPELLLKLEGLGNGYSTPILHQGHIYISGRRDTVEVLTKVNLQGQILWESTYGLSWDRSFPESRSTPTIEGDRIYIMGGKGRVSCLDTESGEILWSNNTHENYGGEFHRWGMAESLLLTDRAVISSPIGGPTSVVALDRSDGQVLWTSDSVAGVRSYVSPLMIEHRGRQMILITSSQMLFAVDPSTGEILWESDVVTGYTGDRNRRNLTNTPLYHEGEIYLTTGYDAEAIMFRLRDDGQGVELKWKNDTLDNHHGGVVLLDGYIYGANWQGNGFGMWVCQEWETGKIMWEHEWVNKGSLIYADGMLYLFEEKRGGVALVKPSPGTFELISSFQPEGGAGPWWAHPSIYDRKLLLRHGEVLFVYDIAKK